MTTSNWILHPANPASPTGQMLLVATQPHAPASAAAASGPSAAEVVPLALGLIALGCACAIAVLWLTRDL